MKLTIRSPRTVRAPFDRYLDACDAYKAMPLRENARELDSARAAWICSMGWRRNTAITFVERDAGVTA